MSGSGKSHCWGKLSTTSSGSLPTPGMSLSREWFEWKTRVCFTAEALLPDWGSTFTQEEPGGCGPTHWVASSQGTRQAWAGGTRARPAHRMAGHLLLALKVEQKAREGEGNGLAISGSEPVSTQIGLGSSDSS
jgi:hypothetical protein